MARLAASQNGRVQHAQLRGFGLSERRIRSWRDRGLLHYRRRGVYAYGYFVHTRHGEMTEALLASGDYAAVGYRAGGELWNLRVPVISDVEVIVPKPMHQVDGILRHFVRLKRDEVTRRHDMWVTNLPRTLLDLAAVLDHKRDLERAIEDAHALDSTYADGLARLIARHPRRPGVPRLREILGAGTIGTTYTLSDKEERLFPFFDGYGIQRPLMNHPLELKGRTIYPDCTWPDERGILELDSASFHGDWRARRRDIARDRALKAIGWNVIRASWEDLVEDPATLADELKAMLAG